MSASCFTSNLENWINDQRLSCDMHVEELPWRESSEWQLDQTAIQHKTGGFFRVVGAGISVDGVRQPHLDQPLIDQPEIGILGFLLCGIDQDKKILVQSKPEPGNVGLVHAAPSVQATESNYKRRHRGKATPYLDYFLGTADCLIVSDSLQSEQGTRFLGKYNRNMLVELPHMVEVAQSDAYRWVPVCELLELLNCDFYVNTDARSVFASSHWEKLSPSGKPFTRWSNQEGLGASLLSSYQAGESESVLLVQDILRKLDFCREVTDFQMSLVDLSVLSGWQVSETSISNIANAGFEVRHFRVSTSEREVSRWDQPLVASTAEGSAILLAQEKNGVLHFLFNCRAEIGFREKCQYGPTILEAGSPQIFLASQDLETELQALVAQADLLLSNQHSDEGGRFYRSVSQYGIYQLDTDAVVPESDNLSWMSLRQIERLTKRKGVFSNEARSLISMLLGYL